MKKTAGELIETITVDEKCDGAEIRVTAWCPICGKPFSSVGVNVAELKAAAVNSTVTHIRISHPDD